MEGPAKKEQRLHAYIDLRSTYPEDRDNAAGSRSRAMG